MSRRGHEAAESGIFKWIVYIALGVVLCFWPLLIDQHKNGNPQWWAWLIEVPWLVIAFGIIGSIRSMSAKSRRKS